MINEINEIVKIWAAIIMELEYLRPLEIEA
jgi:hypothetical protein